MTGNLVSTIAQEMKQEELNATLVSGTNAYEKDFTPGSAGNGTLITGVDALYRGDAKSVPAVATFDKRAKKKPAQKIPGQCWLVARSENGTWQRIKPDPKSGFVCSPKGFIPASYKGISR